MLTKSMIKEQCNSASYTRGVDLYNRGKVEFFEVFEEFDLDLIEAIVEGSSYNEYGVSVTYNMTYDGVEMIDCDCPAFTEYGGICKHCVAVLLQYIDYQKYHKNQMEKAMLQEDARYKIADMKGMRNNPYLIPEPEVETTPMLKAVLNQRVVKKVLPMVQDNIYGKVQLAPELKLTRNGIQLEFKIGISHMYVLKDIISFVEAIDGVREVNYGKKLKFVHTLDAFTEEDRLIVDFLRSWVTNYFARAENNSYGGYSYYYANTKMRSITLSGEELEHFLQILGDKSVVTNDYTTDNNVWRLTDEKLPRNMVVRGITDGIEIEIDHYEGYRGSKHNIYFHEGKIYRVNKKELAPIEDFLNCMAYLSDRKAIINKKDIPLFCRELLPTLEEHFTCTRENFDEGDYDVIAAEFEFYLDAPEKDVITCKTLAVYGEDKYNIYNEEENAEKRDKVKEVYVGNIIRSFCNAYNNVEKMMVIAKDEDKFYDMLVYGIPKLQEIGEVFISDALKKLNVVTSSKVAVGVALEGNILSLQVTSENMTKEQLIEILTKYNRKKKYYRLKNGDFINVVDEELESLLDLKEGLQLTKEELKKDSFEVPKYRALYLNEELSEKMPFHIKKNKDFKALIRNMKTVEDNDFDVPESLVEILREYQKVGFLWIKTLKHNGFGGILADDMGLGKTLQVISFLLSEYEENKANDNRKALIVCPASLVYNWAGELTKFAPELPVKIVAGTAKTRKDIISSIEEQDIVVTSYDLLKRDIKHYDDLKFHCQVIDEAQYIKNQKTQAAKAVKVIDAGFKLALTGTPIENKLSELWSIFDYLMKGFLYSYNKFREELEAPIVQSQDEKAMNRLHKMVTPFILRRLKSEVLTDLPDKIEENIYASFSGEQQKLYDAHVTRLEMMLNKQTDEDYNTSKIQILSELTKLRQICCDPALLFENYRGESAKMDLCMELVRNAVDGGHKVLLFSQFTTMLENIQHRLEKEKIGYYSLTGGTSKEKRAKMVEAFNKDETPIFCISLKAGGTGLNLVGADIVIHYDPWWNVAVQNQATDRAHRIGQKNVVNVYKLIAKETVEENIVKLQEKKKALATQVLSGEGINIGSFNKDEIIALLQ